MILSTSQLRDIILNNPNQKLLSDVSTYAKTLQFHLYGTNKGASVKEIEGFEKPNLRQLRADYSRSNKDLCARLLRPIDQVFSAKGGSIYYNLPERAAAVAKAYAADIKSGFSIKQWVSTFWKTHYLDDPGGIILMEILPKQEVIRLRAEGKSFVYPTYVSSGSIYDYQPNGSGLEYLVMGLSKQEKINNGFKPDETIYRVIDDSMDYIVKKEDQTVIILEGLSIPNFFGKVPAILNSDIPDPNNEGRVLSILDEVIELATEFFLKGSIKVTHEFLHGFPKYWEYADDCNECGGNRFVNGEPCKACRGTGKRLMTKVSDAKLLDYPQTKDQPTVTPNVAGYVSPDKTYWEIATTSLQMLEDVMTFTLWGASNSPKTQGLATDGSATKTATQIISDIKPQADRLRPISESAEKRHKFILDMMIKVAVSNNYLGSTVNYGKRYMLEDPDVLWNKYVDARTKGSAASILDDMLVKYYETEYDSDPIKLAIQLKLMKVEPFVHYTPVQVKALMPAEEDFKTKLYYSEWIKTMDDAQLLYLTVDELRTSLQSYSAVKQLPVPEPPKPLPA